MRISSGCEPQGLAATMLLLLGKLPGLPKATLADWVVGQSCVLLGKPLTVSEQPSCELTQGLEQRLVLLCWHVGTEPPTPPGGSTLACAPTLCSVALGSY